MGLPPTKRHEDALCGADLLVRVGRPRPTLSEPRASASVFNGADGRCEQRDLRLIRTWKATKEEQQSYA